MQEGGQITMDFVEEEYRYGFVIYGRDSVKMIMEVLCVDLRKAYNLFLMSGCNVEHSPQHNSRQIQPAARNRRNATRTYNPYTQQLHEFIPHIAQDNDQPSYHTLPIARRRPIPTRVVQECEFDVKFNRFLEFKKKKRSFNKNYQIRRQSSGEQSMSISRKIFNNGNNKKSKRQSPKKLLDLKPYINEVEDDVLHRRCYIKFGKGSMSESLELSFDKKKPLLVFYLRFDNNSSKQGKKEQTVSLGSINVEKGQSSNNSPAKTRHQQAKYRKRKMVIQITDSQPQQKPQKPASLQQLKNQQKSPSSPPNSLTKNDYFKTLLMDPKLVKLINENFQSYLVDVNNYKYESYLREYFEKGDGESYLLVLRVNALEEIQEVGRVGLGEFMVQAKKTQSQQKQQQQQSNEPTLHHFTQTIRSHLKHLLQRLKSTQKDQLQLHQRYRLLQMGIDSFQYIKPPSTAEKIKIKQDRELIRQQEEEFLNLESDLMGLKGEVGEGEGDGGKKGKISKEEVMRKRRQVREGLTKYTTDSPPTTTLMTIKFRLPNGKSLLLTLSPTQTPSYLFSYISSLQIENIGFQQQQQQNGYCERQFDIIRPEDRMSLSQKMNLTLGEIFEGSLMESLSVKER